MSKQADTLFQRSSIHVWFKNEDQDFIFQWMLGYSVYGGLDPGEAFAIASRIKDNDMPSWISAFDAFGDQLNTRAETQERQGKRRSGGETFLKAFAAYRAASQFRSPREPDFRGQVNRFKAMFRAAMKNLEIPIESVAIPYAGKSLPGYFARAGTDSSLRPTLIMIGGGDTYCEDLYFFAGIPTALVRGYNVLMIDLSGQGDTPFDGLYFDVEFEKPISAVVDFAEKQPSIDASRLAIFGISGGGYMVARGAAYEKRLKAVIADTPIIDMARVLETEIPASLLKAPAAVGNTLFKIAGAVNQAAKTNMDKYVWQAGKSDPQAAMTLVRDAQVNPVLIECPMLCLAGEGDPQECLAQTRQCYDALPNPQKGYRLFTVAEGADAHCQANNLRLLHQVVYDWLDEVL